MSIIQNPHSRSNDREKALQLCGWHFERDVNSSHGNSFLESLERDNEYARATAIAVFNLGLQKAVEILERGASRSTRTANLSIVAMALSGFSPEKNSMWRENCLKSSSQLFDPYLRAIFAFLTADNESYDNVLVRKFNLYLALLVKDKCLYKISLQSESEMAVEDRVAFALMFLSDSKLCEYLKKLTQELIEEGDLSGFLLTGTKKIPRSNSLKFNLSQFSPSRSESRRHPNVEPVPRHHQRRPKLQPHRHSSSSSQTARRKSSASLDKQLQRSSGHLENVEPKGSL